jgi:hypothetical protein
VVPTFQPRSAWKTPLPKGGVFFSEATHGSRGGFPQYVIGFMTGEREKERLDDAKSLKAVPLGDEPGRVYPNA